MQDRLLGMISADQRGGPPLISPAYLPNPVGSRGRGLLATTSATTTSPGHGQVHAEGSGGKVAIGSVWGLVNVGTEEMLSEFPSSLYNYMCICTCMCLYLCARMHLCMCLY